MNSSDVPSRITKAFGVNGLKNTIPVDSSTTTDNNGVATFDKGFPEVTMQPLSAGGIPPSGKDMNGVLYSTTIQQQWQNAGMTYPFSQEFSDAVSGYPKGAIVPSSVYTGQWLNLNEANGTQPESASGANTGWVPINNYGITTVSGLTNSSITLSSLQAAKDRIVLTGALTGNINIIFPTWIKSWTVQNSCTGNFTITCKTASGSGVQVISGLTSRIFCDGVNITDETFNANNDMVGAVLPFAMNLAPTGWLICNGQEVSRTAYARLFSRIGTLYGSGDGTTTFRIPDMRGEFVRGFDAGRGVDVGRMFGSYQSYAMERITASFTTRPSVSSSSVATQNIVGTTGSMTLSALSAGDYIPTQTVGSTGYKADVVNFDSSSQTQTSTETRPRNIALLYCIKF